MTCIIPPDEEFPEPHSCRKLLPASKGGWGPTDHAVGTIAVCECGRIYVVDTEWTGQEMENVFRMIYWTERKLRKRAKLLAGDWPTEGGPVSRD